METEQEEVNFGKEFKAPRGFESWSCGRTGGNGAWFWEVDGWQRVGHRTGVCGKG